MTRVISRRTVLLIGLAACLLVAAALWLISLGKEPGDSVAVPPTQADRTADPSPGEASLEAGSEAPVPRRGESAAGTSSLPPLHVPDYGPDLRRSSARAVFDLRDARGEPLEPAIPRTAELRRKVGEEWVSHPVSSEPGASRVSCEGPGEYELDVGAGPYGSLREPFTLLRGDILQRALGLPRWRRIIRLEVQDNLGRPLGRITQAPEYLYEDESQAPARPAFWSRSRRGWEAYYETDGGAYFVRVFAGLPAKLKIDVEEQRYGRGVIVLESDFTEAEWSAYPIVLEPVPGLHQQMDADAWVDVNPEDPGSRSLLTAPILPPPPRLDPLDLGDMLGGRIRMVVQVDTPIPVRMESESGTPHRAGGDIVDRALWQTDDLWFMDVMLHPGGGTLPTSCTFTDDFLFRAEVPVQPVRPMPEITPEMWGKTAFEFRARLQATPVDLSGVAPTPTLAAYARTVAIESGHGQHSYGSIAIEPDPSGKFHVHTGLSNERAGKLLEQAFVTVTFRGGGENGFRVWRSLDAAARKSLVSGSLLLEGGGEGLVLRVVDREGNGITGVEGRIESTEGTVLHSDSDGYVLGDLVRLAPGTRCVLFLSSPSHEPRRVDFEATPGISDLGVVRLPSR
jgi:hypothetical protein